MLPFFIKAIQLGLGIIVLNPNENSVKVFVRIGFHKKVTDYQGRVTRMPVPHNETADMHVL